MTTIIIIKLTLAFLAIATYLAFIYYTRFKCAEQRIAVIVDFMQYLETEKDCLPKHIRFNYEACWGKAVKLMDKQNGKART